MNTTIFSLADLGWIILGLALLALIIFLIVTFANLVRTLKKVNTILDDVKTITEIASERTVILNDMAQGAADELKAFLETLSPSIKNIFQSISARIIENGKHKEERRRQREEERKAKKAAREAKRLEMQKERELEREIAQKRKEQEVSQTVGGKDSKQSETSQTEGTEAK